MSRPTADEQADALERELTPDDLALLDKLADGITRRRLTAPALFFLESMKPFNFVAATAMVFFRPLIQTIFTNPLTYDRLRTILERRGSIELLLRRLEARA